MVFPLLTSLTHIELQAAALDGECYQLAGKFFPTNVPDSPATRAAALLADRARRLIAARRSAAWVWSAGELGRTVEFVVDLQQHWRPPQEDGVLVVESVIRANEVIWLDKMGVTTPLRTALDLLRFLEDYTETERAMVQKLAYVGSFTLADALAVLDNMPRLSGKRRSISRLTETFS